MLSAMAMRTLQEWMGHRDFKTILISADYAPSANEALTSGSDSRRP
jgi:hypothetical protein